MSKGKISAAVILLIMVLAVHGSVFAAVSYLGPKGTYTEEAAVKYFGEREKLVPFNTAQEVLNELLSAKVNYAVVPVENTTGGPTAYGPLVTDNYSFVIVGEIVLPIRQMFLGVRGAGLSDIKTVLAHPHSIAQSSVWLRDNLPNAKVLQVSNTAEGAGKVAESGDKSIGAIGSARAALNYKLDILGSDLQYTDTNFTRFWVVATQNRMEEKGSKATLLVEGDIQKLHRLLSSFERERLKVVTVRDYPTKTKLGQYNFLIEVVSKNTKDKKLMAESLISVGHQQKDTFKIRIIGIYEQSEDWPK